MNPNFYIELAIKNLDMNMPSCDGILPPIVIAVSRLVNIFHKYNKLYNCNSIAISFPEFRSSHDFKKIGFKIRFFAEERDSFDDIIDFFDANEFVLKHFDVKGVRKVKSDISKYSAFVSLKTARRIKFKNGKYSGLNESNYFDRIKYLNTLPCLKMRSSSNKNNFDLFVERYTKRETEKEDIINNDNVLNSYGFSSKNKLIYLPDF